MLFLPPGTSHLSRAQGAFISDEDINRIIASLTEKRNPEYLIESFDNMSKLGSLDSEPKDKLYDEAVSVVLHTNNASTTFLQRKLKIGYARAASLMDELEENGIIGPLESSGKGRQILVSKEQWEERE